MRLSALRPFFFRFGGGEQNPDATRAAGTLLLSPLPQACSRARDKRGPVGEREDSHLPARGEKEKKRAAGIDLLCLAAFTFPSKGR